MRERKRTERLRERDIDHHLFASTREARGEDHTESSKGIRKEGGGDREGEEQSGDREGRGGEEGTKKGRGRGRGDTDNFNGCSLHLGDELLILQNINENKHPKDLCNMNTCG